VNKPSSYHARKQVMWGLLLIGFGAAIILDRMDMFEFDQVWHYLPLVLTVMGINKMIGYPTARDFCKGFWQASLGVWLFVCLENLYGMTFGNSWPILIVIYGVELILEPLLTKHIATDMESNNEK
jgi:hypothetical protein